MTGWQQEKRTDNHDGELNTFLDLVSSASACERHAERKFCRCKVENLKGMERQFKNGVG
jgi:hypothetical protein